MSWPLPPVQRAGQAIGQVDLLVVGGVGRDMQPRVTVRCDCPNVAELRALVGEVRGLVDRLLDGVPR